MLGQWGNIIIGLGLFGLGIAILLIIGEVKRSQNQAEARINILAEIRTETGWPLRKTVTPFPDGWVRVGKGDYMLPRIADNSEISAELVGVGAFVTAEEAQRIRKAANDGQKTLSGTGRAVKTIVTEWDWYPSAPWLGLRWTQVPIRKQCWWENDPRPIVRPRDKIDVTAADAQAHTKEMDAMNLGVRIQEAEARQKQFIEALTNQPNKMIVYILLGANIFVSIIGVLVSTGRIGG